MAFFWIEISLKKFNKIRNLRKTKKFVQIVGFLYFIITFALTFYYSGSLTIFCFSSMIFEFFLAIFFLIGRAKVSKLFKESPDQGFYDKKLRDITRLTSVISLMILLHILFSLTYAVADTNPDLGWLGHSSSICSILTVSISLATLLSFFEDFNFKFRTSTSMSKTQSRTNQSSTKSSKYSVVIIRPKALVRKRQAAQSASQSSNYLVQTPSERHKIDMSTERIQPQPAPNKGHRIDLSTQGVQSNHRDIYPTSNEDW